MKTTTSLNDHMTRWQLTTKQRHTLSYLLYRIEHQFSEYERALTSLADLAAGRASYGIEQYVRHGADDAIQKEAIASTLGAILFTQDDATSATLAALLNGLALDRTTNAAQHADPSRAVRRVQSWNWHNSKVLTRDAERVDLADCERANLAETLTDLADLLDTARGRTVASLLQQSINTGSPSVIHCEMSKHAAAQWIAANAGEMATALDALAVEIR